MENLDLLAKAALDVGAALVVRDRLIWLVRSQGASLRLIAETTGLSPEGVRLICERSCRPGGG